MIHPHITAVSDKPINSTISTPALGNPTSLPPIKVCLDKISVCLDYSSPSDRDAIKQALYDCAKDPFAFSPAKRGRYKFAVRARVQNGGQQFGQVLIHADPRKPEVSFLRLEWNPSHLGLEGHSFFYGLLQTCTPGGYKYLHQHGKITRIDVAMDIAGCAPIDLTISKPWGRKRMFVVNQGQVDTIYLGRSPGHQLAIYNRSKAKGKSLFQVPADLLRIEIRSRRTTPFAQLPSMPNPFTDFVVHDFRSAGSPLGDPATAHFFDACRLRGVPAALKLIPKGQRAPYQQAVACAEAKWWQPDEIWAKWPQVISDLYPKLSSVL